MRTSINNTPLLAHLPRVRNSVEGLAAVDGLDQALGLHLVVIYASHHVEHPPAPTHQAQARPYVHSRCAVQLYTWYGGSIQ